MKSAAIDILRELASRGIRGALVGRIEHALITVVDGREITDLELSEMPLVHHEVHFDPESIRALREALGWSRPQLADALGVVPLTIARWEGHESTPHAARLGDLVDLAFRHQVPFEPFKGVWGAIPGGAL